MLLGIVLAGGCSSRMGRDKALLMAKGKTQLQRAYENLQRAGCERVVISRNAPGCIADNYPQQGPLAGLQACLEAVACDQALVIPVDMPLLQISSLQALIQHGRKHDCACYFNGSVLPCYLNDSVTSQITCTQRLQKGQRSIHGFVQAIAAEAITLSKLAAEREQLLNSNTPQQWAQAHAKIHRGEPLWDA